MDAAKIAPLLIAAEAASISCTRAVLFIITLSLLPSESDSPSGFNPGSGGIDVDTRSGHIQGSFRNDILPDGGQGCLHLLHQGYVACHYNVVFHPGSALLLGSILVVSPRC